MSRPEDNQNDPSKGKPSATNQRPRQPTGTEPGTSRRVSSPTGSHQHTPSASGCTSVGEELGENAARHLVTWSFPSGLLLVSCWFHVVLSVSLSFLLICFWLAFGEFRKPSLPFGRGCFSKMFIVGTNPCCLPFRKDQGLLV